MLSVWQRNLVDRFGNVVPNASVEVRDTVTGELSEIYSDSEGETPLDNPFTADASGFAKFYASGGLYNITVHAEGAPFTWEEVSLGALSHKDKITADVITDDADELAAIRSKLDVTAAEDALSKDNNLSDLSSALLARQNLGLGTAATYDYSDFDEAGSAALVADSLEDLEGSLGELSVKDTVSEAIGDADAVNVNARLGEFHSVADAEARHIPPALDSIRTNGYNSPGDGGGALYKRVSVEPDHPGKLQSADGAWWEDVGYNTITVRIPSDFPTLRAAIDHYSRLPLRQGAIIDLLIEAGHKLTHGLRLDDNRSYRQFRISAEDAVVYLDPDFDPVDSSEVPESNRAIFCFLGVEAPVLNCLIDGEGTSQFDGWISAYGAKSKVATGCGIMGTRMNLEVRSSEIFANGSVWDNARRGCARLTAGAFFSISGAKFNYGWQGWTEANPSVASSLHISRGSFGQAQSAEIHNAGRTCVTVRRSYACLINSDFGEPGGKSDYTGTGIHIQDGAVAVLNGSTMDGQPLWVGTGAVTSNIGAFNRPTSSGIVFYYDGTPGEDPVIEYEDDPAEGYVIYMSGRCVAWKTAEVAMDEEYQTVSFPLAFTGSYQVYASFNAIGSALSGAGVGTRTRWLNSLVLGARGDGFNDWGLRTSETTHHVPGETINLRFIAWGWV